MQKVKHFGPLMVSVGEGFTLYAHLLGQLNIMERDYGAIYSV
ncbi:hypothetical protein [Streptococcus orisratti]